MIRRFWTLLPGILLAPFVCVAQAAPDAAADRVLQRLVGRWRMSGQVRGAPVTYDLVVTRVLRHRYVDLHMRDTARVPEYEARVTLGADTTANGILVHWLDSFGAAFSVPSGKGIARGDSIRFDVPYPDGPFRDTIVLRAGGRAWTLLIESQGADGRWSTFASYDVRRRGAAGNPR